MSKNVVVFIMMSGERLGLWASCLSVIIFLHTAFHVYMESTKKICLHFWKLYYCYIL